MHESYIMEVMNRPIIILFLLLFILFNCHEHEIEENPCPSIFIKGVYSLSDKPELDGTTILASKNKTLYSFDKENGNLVWKTTLGGEPEAGKSDGTYFYLTAKDGNFYIVNIQDGTISFSFSLNNVIGNNQAKIFYQLDSLIYLYDDGEYYALDPWNKKLVWKTSIKCGYFIDVYENSFFSSFRDNGGYKIIRFASDSGAVIGQSQTLTAINSLRGTGFVSQFCNNRLWVFILERSSENAKVLALSPQNFDVEKEFTLDKINPLFGAFGIAFTDNSVIYPYLPNDNYYLRRFNYDNLMEVWLYPGLATLIFNNVIDRMVIIYNGNNFRSEAIDTETGKLVWAKDTYLQSGELDGLSAYLLSYSNLTKINLQTGQVIWTEPLQ